MPLKYKRGDYLKLGDGRKGICLYAGPIHCAPGDFIGIMLDGRNGKHDGEVKGTRYFQTPPRRGLMVPLAKVQKKMGRKPIKGIAKKFVFSGGDDNAASAATNKRHRRSATAPAKSLPVAPAPAAEDDLGELEDFFGEEPDEELGTISTSESAKIGSTFHLGNSEKITWDGGKPKTDLWGSVGGVSTPRTERLMSVPVPYARESLRTERMMSVPCSATPENENAVREMLFALRKTETTPASAATVSPMPDSEFPVSPGEFTRAPEPSKPDVSVSTEGLKEIRELITQQHVILRSVQAQLDALASKVKALEGKTARISELETQVRILEKSGSGSGDSGAVSMREEMDGLSKLVSQSFTVLDDRLAKVERAVGAGADRGIVGSSAL